MCAWRCGERRERRTLASQVENSDRVVNQLIKLVGFEVVEIVVSAKSIVVGDEKSEED